MIRYLHRILDRIAEAYITAHYYFYGHALKDRIRAILSMDERSAGLESASQLERAIPGFRRYKAGGYYKFMLARHMFAIKYIKDKVVLDSACGLGWGSYLLSPYPKELISIDIDGAAIDFAKSAWKDDRLRFTECSVLELKRLARNFDVILGFEVIEHLSKEDSKKYIETAYGILNDNGMLILSSYFPLSDSEAASEIGYDVYHKHIYTRGEIAGLLAESKFSNIKRYGYSIITARR